MRGIAVSFSLQKKKNNIQLTNFMYSMYDSISDNINIAYIDPKRSKKVTESLPKLLLNPALSAAGTTLLQTSFR